MSSRSRKLNNHQCDNIASHISLWLFLQVRRVTLCKCDGKHCRWHSSTGTLCYSNAGGLITYCIALFGHFDASLQQLRCDCSTKNMKKPRTSVTKCMTLRLLYTSSLTGLLTVFLNGN
ncbi:hypothetical protein T05_14621 [Trichinella murrelli]|uniref:Uncharacterized protein n=1 Tax=Trichinella murrelli TaxID=144512 RepID=A0A0V0T1E1_9BILA|nr:hypothetical protein T05_14621 [Trichinella murrelli]